MKYKRLWIRNSENFKQKSDRVTASLKTLKTDDEWRWTAAGRLAVEIFASWTGLPIGESLGGRKELLNLLPYFALRRSPIVAVERASARLLADA